MHADAAPGETHPVGHGGSDEFAAFGNFVFCGIGVGIVEVAFGVVDLAVEIGAFVRFEFLEDLVVSGRGREGPLAGRDGVVHGNFVALVEHGTLQAEIDGDPGPLSVVHRGAVPVNVVGLRVGGISAEVIVAARRVGVHEDGPDFRGLVRVARRGHGGAAREQTGEEGQKEDRF